MIAYRVLRAFGRLALRWFYREIEVVGMDRIPARGPVLLASNHPNALVDALVIGCTLRRRVTLTAKATLLKNPLTRVILRLVGVVPLRRTSDDAAAHGATAGPVDPARNADAFSAVLDMLRSGGAVLIFPEGKSHSDSTLAPLKTGLARIALMAQADPRIGTLPIIPIGLTFDRKWEPRSRVVMHVGPAIVVQHGVPNAVEDVSTLTQSVGAGLRDVTLNFRTASDATQILTVSTLLAEVFDEFRPLHAPDPPLVERVRLAQRINTIATRLPELDSMVAGRVDQFMTRFNAFDVAIRGYGIAANDVQMNTDIAQGAWFVVRETLIATVAGPLAFWGHLNHWMPLRLARSFASRTSRAPDEPAMNTIVAGLVLVLGFYAAQATLVFWGFGIITAAAYVLSLPPSATWDFRYADRRRRSIARVRTYLRFRRNPELQHDLLHELVWLRAEAAALNSAVDQKHGEPSGPGNLL